MKKHLLCLAASALLAFGMSSSFAAPKKAEYDIPKPQESYLFNIHSDKGDILKGSNGRYILNMQLSDIDQVIMFSRQPGRFFRYISASELQKIWRDGTNSFKADPPNAVLSVEDNNPAIVILKNVTVKGNKISFLLGPIKGDGGLARPFKGARNITLTIDGANGISMPPSPIDR